MGVLCKAEDLTLDHGYFRVRSSARTLQVNTDTFGETPFESKESRSAKPLIRADRRTHQLIRGALVTLEVPATCRSLKPGSWRRRRRRPSLA